MNPRLRVLPCLLFGLVVGGCGESSEPSRVVSGLEADPWIVVSDEVLVAQIAEARRQAGLGGRRVLLDFIADWCEDCHEVVRLSHQEPARTVIEERYVVVYVNVGRFDRHRALLAEHEITRIAALVVLDPESGTRIARRTLEPIHGEDRGLTSEALAAWLRAPADP